MHTLAQLQAGELSQVRRLQIAENLTEFPDEIFDLADTLEILDLSNNQLDCLPDNFGRLHRLQILFLSNNQFKQIPRVIADCANLNIIGFKANRISSVPESAFPQGTRWLILTDNQIEKLPDSIGELPRLQKLMLAGNRLTELPSSLAKCTDLQLMRISANQLSCLPDWLMQMPKLAWLAFAGNPFSRRYPGLENAGLHKVGMSDIQLHEQLGEGASGVIYRAKWIKQPAGLQRSEERIAVKLFKGHVNSDGYPLDELQATLTAGNHPNLVQMTAHISESDQLGLVMGLIPSTFYNLGLPPSLATCTRDTFVDGFQLTLAEIIKIATSVADTLIHLHDKGLCHGDLYAHNILVDPDATVLLGDFGAASNFLSLSGEQRDALQVFEARAYGHLLDDLLSLCSDRTSNSELFEQLSSLKNICTYASVKTSLTFSKIKHQLQTIISDRQKAQNLVCKTAPSSALCNADR
ncbi:MAG: protein kinase [Methylobacter sp.]